MYKYLQPFVVSFIIFLFVPRCYAQPVPSLYDQLLSVNEQWANVRESNAELKSTAARPCTEQSLIQLHLQQVETLLRKRDVCSLTEAQKARRVENLNTLHKYWKAGVFPINDGHTNRQPYFIDKYNTYCAVGYLMKESGGDAMSRSINASQNYSYLLDIQHPQLMDWVQQSGLSLDELALIQPGYLGEWPAAVMEFHYNNAGADVNEYIEVHESTRQLSGGTEVRKILFYDDSTKTVPYKILPTAQMQFYTYSSDRGGGRVFYYTFPSGESFADQGKIELRDSLDRRLQEIKYTGSSVSQYDYFPGFATPNTSRFYSVGENENTPANTSLTYCGAFWGNNWNLQSIPATLGTQNPCTIMPVGLVNLSYTIENQIVNLLWNTASESNTKEFVVERSNNGYDFTPLGKVAAAGTSNSTKNYLFIDKKPNYINHYRLRQLDKDGKSSYSKMLYVKVSSANPLQVASNVVKSNLNVEIKAETRDVQQLVIYDFSGKEIRSVKAKSGSQVINVDALAAGRYLIRLIASDGQVFGQQFVKE